MYERTIICIGTLAWLSACVGTDTGNPVVDTRISECKSGGSHSDAVLQALTLPNASASYDGFECYRWERNEERVRFDVYNFNGGCAIMWTSTAAQSDASHLDFTLHVPRCTFAGCGSCLYDATFEVDTVKSPLVDDAKVRLFQDNCSDHADMLGRWELQAGDTASGIQCSYAKDLIWNDNRSGRSGMLHATCRGSDEDSASACDEGLACTKLKDRESMCLQKCTTTDDCPLQDILECRDEVCQLKRD